MVTLELTVQNHPGVMSHVCGLFARRAFNVEGILCLPVGTARRVGSGCVCPLTTGLVSCTGNWKNSKTC
ncbi:MAG: hypothetical protein PCFJNLEI_00510 [Verrucomicrobiae bacterium]|nr:hypothetical protein [Verrucomicrobiae bacterium]